MEKRDTMVTIDKTVKKKMEEAILQACSMEEYLEKEYQKIVKEETVSWITNALLKDALEYQKEYQLKRSNQAICPFHNTMFDSSTYMTKHSLYCHNSLCAAGVTELDIIDLHMVAMFNILPKETRKKENESLREQAMIELAKLLNLSK
jgi:hypothetical protein